METRGKIIGKKYGDSDDWILVTDDIDKAFSCISEILDHTTGYTNYEKIPLEIAIGAEIYDRWAKFDGANLIIENPTIAFLKTNIIGRYCESYKEMHRGKSVESTFLLLTESAFLGLESLDKRTCQKIECQPSQDDKKSEAVRFFVADLERVQHRGRVSAFLEKVGCSNSKWYGRIEELYVAPIEYEEIRRTLKNNRIILITGTPEYGKTYTAVRIMWEYYEDGYEPVWIQGREEIERIKVREALENIGSQLKSGRIVYFEDPFGKTRYEKRENLEREVGTVFDSIKHVENCFVVITSREEVFKEFEKEQLSAKDLKDIEIKLNIKKPSYDYDRRKEILLKWAETDNCRWLELDNLKNGLLDILKDKRFLPTPLSIRDFVIATTKTVDSFELAKQLVEKSEVTSKVFAKEIQGMTDDKILFLSFPLLSSHFKVEFVRNAYEQFVQTLELRDAWDFDRLLNWFREDKVDIKDGYLQFAHPSYSESLSHILKDNGNFTAVNERILTKLLFWLVNSRVSSIEMLAAGDISVLILRNFGGFPGDPEQLLLIKLSESVEVAGLIAIASIRFYDSLPEDFVAALLLKLSENMEMAKAIAWDLIHDYDKLPEDFVTALLLKLSENMEMAKVIAWDLIHDYDKLPEDFVTALLLKLSENMEMAKVIAWDLIHDYDKLPEDFVTALLLKLAKNVKTAEVIAWDLIHDYDKLPEDFVTDLLLKLAENVETAKAIAVDLVSDYDKLPEDFVTPLLLKLAEREEVAKLIAVGLVRYCDKIPESSMKALLPKLAERQGVADLMAYVVKVEKNGLPHALQNEPLAKLPDNVKDNSER